MKLLLAILFSTKLIYGIAAMEKPQEIKLSLNDSFKIKDTKDWEVKILKYLPLRTAEISVLPKNGSDFSMTLYFKTDTPDLAKFNTDNKMKDAVLSSSKQYLPYITEKEISIKKLSVKRYGYYTEMTDKELVNKKVVPNGEFKYMIRGMLRLSDDSTLGFSVMVNDTKSDLYKELMDYILNFELPSTKP